MIKAKVLVTAGAGRTGSAAVHQLLALGFPVRAFVHRRDYRAKLLEQAGAEIFVGDLLDFRDLRKAVQGVQRAYHCPPFGANLLHGSMMFALAAEEAKLEVVALLSGWNPHPTHPALATREHWIANNVYRWMPSVDVIHINPGLFAFVYLLSLPIAVHFGMLVGAFGEGLNAPPSNEDIASVVVGALTDPASHIGKSYRPTGPELISAHDVASVLGRALKRPVSYRNVSSKVFVKAAMAQGFPLFEISQIRHYLAELQRGAFAIGAPTEHVREVGGRPPEPFESIARRYIQQPALIHPQLAIGSKFDAVRFILRMLRTRAPDFDAWEGKRGHPLLTDPVLAPDCDEWTRAAQQKQLYLLESAATSPHRGSPPESEHLAARLASRPSAST